MVNCKNFTDKDIEKAHTTGLALFDFDGTLTYKDTFITFLTFLRGNYCKVLLDVLTHPKLLLGFLLYLLDSNRLDNKFEHGFHFYVNHYLGKRSLLELAQIVAAFQPTLKAILRPHALERILWHKNSNHLVIIVSATADFLLVPFCEELGIKLIATELELRDNIFTGKVIGPRCNGVNKVHFIKKCLGELNKNMDIYTYGNNKKDLPMLNLTKPAQQFYRYKF